MLRVATSLATVAFTAHSLETYQFPDGKDPYRWFRNDVEPKPLNLHIRQDVAPVEGHMMFPNVTGKYPWIDVQHGFLGEFPELVYSEWLATLADMGFVVTYGMPQGMRNPADNFTAWDEWNTWVKENANDYLQEAGAIHDLDIEIDTDYLGLVCHADGCDMTKQFMIDNPDRAQGYFFLDPVYSLDNVDTPVTLNNEQTVVVAQSDMCSRCCIANEDFNQRTFNSISGMNIKTNQLVSEKGHCSPFNYWFNDNCRKGRYCEMPRDSMHEVRGFHVDLTGWITAQMTYSMFEGRNDMKKYFTDVKRMPDDFLASDKISCQSDKIPDQC